MLGGIKSLVLASRNADKIKELQLGLEALGVEVKSSLDFPSLEDVDEDANTLEGNAYKKAEYTYRMTGLPSLADDTGLEVDALNGEPGVFSARYAGENVTYADNVKKLLKELGTKHNRDARFRTVVCLVCDEGVFTFQGVCDGTILDHTMGTGGFGYDPVFKPIGYDKTFAELTPEIKNEISHRGKAIKQFVNFLKDIFS